MKRTTKAILIALAIGLVASLAIVYWIYTLVIQA